jgi:hypothetical protein
MVNSKTYSASFLKSKIFSAMTTRLHRIIFGLLLFAAGIVCGAAAQKYYAFVLPLSVPIQLPVNPRLLLSFASIEVGRRDDIPGQFHGKLSLFILAGQSNMSGYGALPAAQIIDSRVFVFGNNYRWRTASEPIDAPDGQVDEVSMDRHAGFGPGLAFATSLRKHNPNIGIGLIPCAKGGSSIEEWQRNLSDHTLYGSCLKRLRAATTMGKVAGLLFFQGEADAVDPKRSPGKSLSPPTYAAKFSTFVNDLRNDVSITKLPLVFAQIGTHTAPKYFVNWDIVKEQQKNSHIPCSVMITTDDLALRDEVHFTTESYQIIGERYAKAMLNLLTRPCE